MARPRRISVVKPNAQDFASVAERHLDDVHAFLVYLTGDRNVAEDLTAETFARALERWGRFDPRRGSARTWLCQLARSTALDHFRSEERRRRREGRYSVDVREPVEAPFGSGLSPELEGVLDAPQPRSTEAGEGGERRCRRLSSSTIGSRSSRRSCARRGPSPRRSC